MDLGSFNKTVLLFGGPYSNLDALLAIKEKAAALNIEPDHVICTGDTVAYCGQPFETVEAIRQWGIPVLMGNCEESFATNAMDCGCGFEEGTSCDLLSVEWFQFANTQLSSEQRNWFSNLPRTLTFHIANKKVQVVHGSVTTINQFIFHSSDTEEYHRQLSQTDADIIVAGHSGLPFSKRIGKQLWHNAGAIGMPANDGNPHTWYSLLTPESDKLRISSHTLEYNHQNAKQKMVDVQLNNAYASALESGLWPSLDVLPETEKKQQGEKITPATILYP